MSAPDLRPWRDALARLQSAENAISEAQLSEGEMYSIVGAIHAAVEAIEYTMPTDQCPYCLTRGCRFCERRGYVSKERLKLAAGELL